MRAWQVSPPRCLALTARLGRADSPTNLHHASATWPQRSSPTVPCLAANCFVGCPSPACFCPPFSRAHHTAIAAAEPGCKLSTVAGPDSSSALPCHRQSCHQHNHLSASAAVTLSDAQGPLPMQGARVSPSGARQAARQLPQLQSVPHHLAILGRCLVFRQLLAKVSQPLCELTVRPRAPCFHQLARGTWWQPGRLRPSSLGRGTSVSSH